MNDGNKAEIYHRLDYLDIKILDCIYNKEMTVVRTIRERLKGVATRKTIEKRIKILSDMRLINIIQHTNPLCIEDNDKYSQIIKEYINKQKVKMELI